MGQPSVEGVGQQRYGYGSDDEEHFNSPQGQQQLRSVGWKRCERTQRREMQSSEDGDATSCQEVCGLNLRSLLSVRVRQRWRPLRFCDFCTSTLERSCSAMRVKIALLGFAKVCPFSPVVVVGGRG